MLVLIHTVTMTVADIEVSAKFYHAVCPSPQRLPTGLIAKRIGVTLSKNKAHCGRFKFRPYQPRLRHNLQAIVVGAHNNGVVRAAEQVQDIVNSVLSSPTVNSSSLPDRPVNSDNVLAIQGSSDVILASNATSQETTAWLQINRFSALVRSFANFSGADILRLSRDDLIQICGLAEGIRLYTALHPQAKTIYLRVTGNQTSPEVYHAVFLANLSSREVRAKVASLMRLSLVQIHDVYIQGPNGIHVLITDELVSNIKDQSTFTIEIIQDSSTDRYRLLLKPPAL